MRTLKKSLSQALFLVAGAAGVASGNAFNVNEHDARVTGRGGASAATNTDPSSIVFNPGGIPVAEGTQVAINGSLYIAQGSYEPPGGERVKTDSNPSAVPSLYITSRLHDMVSAGFAVHLPFGLAVSWPEDHPQANVIQDQELRTYFLTPAVGINLNKYVPGLSIGGGIDIVPATVELERKVFFGEVEGNVLLGGDAVGFGGRIGVMYNPEAVPALRVGAMWRSSVKLDFSGEGDFDMPQPFRDALPPDGDITTSIKLPQSVAGGVAYNPIQDLQLEVNLVWINWNVFEELRINLPDGSASVAAQNYQNTVTFRIGAEYALPKYDLALRAGFVYDPSPIPTTTQSAQLPDINRKNVTIGASYKFLEKYAAHLGLLWVTPGNRDTSDELYMPFYKANYGVQALVTSLMVSGTFGAGASPAPAPDPTATTSMR